jgi:hypothetical protein
LRIRRDALGAAGAAAEGAAGAGAATVGCGCAGAAVTGLASQAAVPHVLAGVAKGFIVSLISLLFCYLLGCDYQTTCLT